MNREKTVNSGQCVVSSKSEFFPELRWKTHFPRLLNEIADCALPRNMGILKLPLNDIMKRMNQLVELANEIQDPRLFMWCCDMTIVEVSDPDSEGYDLEAVELVRQSANKLHQEYLQQIGGQHGL